MKNLEKDLILLSSSLGRSVDDAILTVHIILKRLSQMSDQNFPSNLYSLNSVLHVMIIWFSVAYKGDCWSSGDDRQQWECDFSQALIEPVVKNVENELSKTYSLVVKGI